MVQKLVRGEKLLGTAMEKLAKQQLAERMELQRASELIRGLRLGRLFEKSAQTAGKRLAEVLDELPRLLEKNSKQIAAGFGHLFPGGTAVANENRLLARRAAKELVALLQDPKADVFFSDPANVQRVEKAAQSMFLHLARDVDSYADLGEQTLAVNALTKRLYPADFASLRLDAHHIIEDTMYKDFKEAWTLLGWRSADDMPCLALMYEFHIRTPKNLPGLQEIYRRSARGDDFVSLSTALRREVRSKKIATAEELIAVCKNFYARKTYIWKEVEPVLTAVENELTRRRTTALGVQQAKKLAKTK